jgi:hypothetical protein
MAHDTQTTVVEPEQTSINIREVKAEGTKPVPLPESEGSISTKAYEGSETSSISGEQTEDEWRLVDTPQ